MLNLVHFLRKARPYDRILILIYISFPVEKMDFFNSTCLYLFIFFFLGGGGVGGVGWDKTAAAPDDYIFLSGFC